VILKSYPANTEIARDTSDATGFYQFNNVLDGSYILAYDKYTPDTMQWGNGIDAIDVTLLKYYIGVDTLVDPSRNFSAKYKKAANVDNNLLINAIDISRIKAKVGSPYNTAKNFPKGNWVALDTNVTVAGSDLSIDLKTICYGDYNASSSKYRDSANNWNMLKSIPENIISVADEYIMNSDPSYIEVPLRISAKINEFSALGLELNYPDKNFRLVGAYMPITSNKDDIIKINPTLEEIIADDNDLLVTDEDGVIRVVFATTKHFDLAANEEIIRLIFRSPQAPEPGELDFKLSGTGVIGNKYGEENQDAYLIMPKIYVQETNSEPGFKLAGYPNPFNDEVTLSYYLPENGTVKVSIFNAIGELLSEPVSELQDSGNHNLIIRQKDLPSGMYTFRMEFTGADRSKCMVLKLIH